MKNDSFRIMLTLGAALVLGLSTGANAAKKSKTPDYVLGNDFRLAARNAQAAMDMGDTVTASARIGALEAAAHTGSEKYIAAALHMQLAAKQADFTAQRKALNAMLESGGAPGSEIPYLRYLAGYFSFMLNELKDCVAQITYARQLGYDSPQATLMLADAHLRMGNYPEGMGFLSQAVTQQRAAGGKADASWYDRAVSFAYKAKDWSGLASWYRQKITQYPAPENWRSAISNYLDNPALTSAMRLDLYRLVSARDALASERDYQAYAQAAVDNGQYGEAKAVIEAGRADGSLLTGDAAIAGMYKTAAARATKDRAKLATQAAKAASAGEAANGYLALGEYGRAAELYRTALAQASADPGLINTRLGIALARSGDREGAQKVLSAVTGPWTDIAQFWLLWASQTAAATPK
ncbi:hypothetical protein [Rhizorhapis sp. SPR117]|uniref:hypothetical protein n=1 Tax=Rhizorhapis sp. SPR117 TaxID=2912611 RepID=UPI001F1E8E9D|nr:hypothetical protein [Rhizorhapis sp. SPR117]